MADEAQSAIATVADSLNEPSGLIRMSSSILTAELYLAGWLGEFMCRYPKVRVSLELSNRFVDLLAERIDLAIRFSTEPLASADVVARPLGLARMVLVASPGLLEKHGAPTEISALAKLPALGQGTLETVRPWSFKGPHGEMILHHPEPRLVVETGGSRGIGAAVARRLAKDGAAVALIYQSNRELAAQVAADIRKQGGRAALFQANVVDEQAVKTAVQQAVAEFGPVNVLANIAGVFDMAPVGNITREMFDQQFLVNTWSVITTTQAVLPHFSPKGGSIINVSTSLVHEPRNGTAVYSASKAALETLTFGFASELGARGIRVNAVAPALAGSPAGHC